LARDRRDMLLVRREAHKKSLVSLRIEWIEGWPIDENDALQSERIEEERRQEKTREDKRREEEDKKKKKRIKERLQGMHDDERIDVRRVLKEVHMRFALIDVLSTNNTDANIQDFQLQIRPQPLCKIKWLEATGDEQLMTKQGLEGETQR
jgi:hypothetical protein